MKRYTKDRYLLKPDPKNGHRYWRYRLPGESGWRSTGQTRKADAADWVDLNILGKTQGTGLRPDTPRLKDYCLELFEEYVESKKRLNRSLSGTYVKRRRRIIEEHIVKATIANKRIGEITLADCERFRDGLLDSMQDKQATVDLTLKAFTWIMGRAFKRGDIDKDPTAGMDHPAIDNRKRTIYTMEELNKLFPADVWEKDDFSPWTDAYDHTAYLLAVTTGMRKGEILALKWSAVHLEDGKEHIEITRNLTDDGEIGRPKSRRPRATPIFDFVIWPDERRTVNALKALRRKQGVNGVIRLDGWVFGDPKSGEIRKGTWWNKRRNTALQEAKINRDRGPGHLPLDGHTMRHTLSSHLAAAGMPEPLRHTFCGWSSTQVADRYTHIDPDLFGRIMETIRVTS